MFCKNCGTELSNEAVVCPHCGIQVGELKTYNNTAQQPNNYAQQPNGTMQQPHNNVVKKDNTIAIVGFILTFFVPLAGLICSIIGYKNAKKYGSDYKGLALAGIIISAVVIGAVVLIYLILICFYASFFGSLIWVGAM